LNDKKGIKWKQVSAIQLLNERTFLRVYKMIHQITNKILKMRIIRNFHIVIVQKYLSKNSKPLSSKFAAIAFLKE